MASWARCWWNITLHKWYVWQIGCVLHVPKRRLLIHDWCKFMPIEFQQYVHKFYTDTYDSDRWNRCWEHHLRNNPHHWNYWIGRPMPEWAVREMVADWLAAGRVYSGKWPNLHHWTWYEEHKHTMNLTPQTKHILAKVLAELRGESNERRCTVRGT